MILAIHILYLKFVHRNKIFEKYTFFKFTRKLTEFKLNQIIFLLMNYIFMFL